MRTADKLQAEMEAFDHLQDDRLAAAERASERRRAALAATPGYAARLAADKDAFAKRLGVATVRYEFGPPASWTAELQRVDTIEGGDVVDFMKLPSVRAPS